MKDYDNLTLDCVSIDGNCYVVDVDENLYGKEKRLYDLGITKNTQIKPLFKSMLGDTVAYLIKGSVIALRNNDAHKIHVSLWR